MMIHQDELERRFTYHAPRGEQVILYQYVRDAGKEFARVINAYCPEEGHELGIALNKVEEAVMWANAAIARRTED